MWLGAPVKKKNKTKKAHLGSEPKLFIAEISGKKHLPQNGNTLEKSI